MFWRIFGEHGACYFKYSVVGDVMGIDGVRPGCLAIFIRFRVLQTIETGIVWGLSLGFGALCQVSRFKAEASIWRDATMTKLDCDGYRIKYAANNTTELQSDHPFPY